MKWWKTARGQLGLISLFIEVWLPLFTSQIIHQGLQPIIWLAIWGPSPAHYFVSYYQNAYGWVFTAVFMIIGISAQISITRRLLRHLDPKDQPYQHRLLLKVYYVCLIGVIALAYLGEAGIAHLFMLMVSLLAPGLWPTYLTLQRYERKHLVNLIISRFAFQINTQALKTPNIC